MATVRLHAERRSEAAADWRWQLRHQIRTAVELGQWLELTPSERQAAQLAERSGLPLGITPYYLSLCHRTDPSCPLRRQVVPVLAEHRAALGDLTDPLGEERHEVVPGLVRRYPDRALWLVTDRCAAYCRFCTRRRAVGREPALGDRKREGAILEYLRAHPEVTDVIVSGGDPFLFGTRRLARLVAALRSVRSVETIRLATRTPVTLPQRITDELVSALRPHHPLWIMTHFNHPREVTGLAALACERLADAGFPLQNQTVLLRGINDDAQVLAALFRALVRVRVRPYYLLQADPAGGTGHLRTALDTGLSLMRSLQGRLSGIALPRLIVDTPGGHGKVPLMPDYVVERERGRTRFRTPGGEEVDYFDPT